MRLEKDAEVRVVARKTGKSIPIAWRRGTWKVERVSDLGSGFGIYVTLVAGKRTICVPRANVELVKCRGR
jgi:hypothetical protein